MTRLESAFLHDRARRGALVLHLQPQVVDFHDQPRKELMRHVALKRTLRHDRPVVLFARGLACRLDELVDFHAPESTT